jgi:SAM-dependent methyltransferase
MEQQTLTGETEKKKEIIKTISYEQDEIMQSIIDLYCPNGFELDPTYSKGNFYKKIPQPKYKFDLLPQSEDVIKADCGELPLEDNSINTIMFDPPFVAGIQNKSNDGIIINRFGSYKNVSVELWNMYHKALKEFYRLLRPNGVLVFKCQDSVDSGKQCLFHVEIINYAMGLGFYPKDMFVLLARNRLIGKHHHKQQHARKFHSYFLVFIKSKNPVKYSGILRTTDVQER